MKAFGFSVLVNIFIFSFLPFLHHFFHKPVSEIKPIQLDLIKLDREKTKLKEKKKEQKSVRAQEPKRKIRPELRRRITYELVPGAFASEVDLIAPMVTYDLSEVDQLPQLLRYIEPDYPEEAITKGIEGVVILKILIDREGKVAMVKILNNGGFHQFGRAASRVVKRWRFEAAKIMNMPVAVWCIQNIRFELKNNKL